MATSWQSSLFGDTDRIINVASVPQRSPFRYPGGKTWLIPYVRKWLLASSRRTKLFIEPFVGGGSIGLTVAAEGLADHVVMVELDDQVAAVWQTILDDSGGAEWLGEQIVSFDLTHAAVVALFNAPTTCRRDAAFRTIVKNRVNRGGILAAGAGLIKQGENGQGLQSRWYPETLQRRIREIASISERITFIHGDGVEVLAQYANASDAAYFIDPPYTAAGKKAGSRLYTHSELNHNELFRLTGTLSGDFLMTYDNATEVQQMVKFYGFASQTVAMKNTHHAKMNELLIGHDLSWLRG